MGVDSKIVAFFILIFFILFGVYIGIEVFLELSFVEDAFISENINRDFGISSGLFLMMFFALIVLGISAFFSIYYDKLSYETVVMKQVVGEDDMDVIDAKDEEVRALDDGFEKTLNSLLSDGKSSFSKLEKGFFEFVEKTSAAAAVFYILDDRQEVDHYVFAFHYAVPKPEKEGCYALGEGIVGEVARQGQPKKIWDIPPDKLQIGTGLGEIEPVDMVFLPLLRDDKKVIGVLELAFFSSISEKKMGLMKKMGFIFANKMESLIAEQSNQLIDNG